MTWSVARPQDKELFRGRRPAADLGPLLGASAVALVVLGILALLAAEDVEPFGGSVSVLAGLLSGAALVVAGAVGVSRRHLVRSPDTTGAGETVETRSSERTQRPDDRARRRLADDTRVIRTVAAGPPAPPPPPPRRASLRAGSTSSRYGAQSPPIARPSSSRTSA
jgi:hypothetical protein